jgi:hypothetical protein
VLGTVREREQPGVPKAPSFKNCHSGLQQPLRYAPAPVFRQHSQGAEEPEGSPARDHIRSDQTATFACGYHLDMGRVPSGRHECAVTHEIERIGHSQKRSECDPDYPLRLLNFCLFQRANFDVLIGRHCVCATESTSLKQRSRGPAAKQSQREELGVPHISRSEMWEGSTGSHCGRGQGCGMTSVAHVQ